MGILFRHFGQMYLGLSFQTYILEPQWQWAKPVKRWTFVRVGFSRLKACWSRRALQVAHSSSATMASTGVCTHSLSGLSSQAPVRSLVRV